MQTSWKFHFGRDTVLSFLLAGMLTVGGVVSAWDTYWLAERGVVATATVLDERPSGKRSTKIDVRFVTQGGQTVETATEHYYGAEVGRQIEILYDPENPKRMQAVNWGLDYQIAMVWLSSALIFTVVGVLCSLGLHARLRELLART